MRPATETIAIAILAKAPEPGLAKTRLIPALGAKGAADLQARMIERAVETACAAGTGAVTLWGAPDAAHPLFRAVASRFDVALARQPEGDLGQRMAIAIEAAGGPVLVIGTDCPALTAGHLREAADALASGADVVVIPAADGGYVLIGLRQGASQLFSEMPWGTSAVMTETRRRFSALGLAARELAPLWDVDTPADLERLERECPDFVL
jgi:rSAM/selenodomain-associated transferase 1